ncbi:UNVERIFIED_CONTAM: hypothetical protein GTU68_059374 [Idotea baltica]|nr:hypothetical protein [Idotea baltica]
MDGHPAQSRSSPERRFLHYRGWLDYQLGFGTLTGEFWLGLDNIHALREKRWAKYDLFHIEDSTGKYRLKLGNYTGDAGDSLSYSNNEPFSIKGADNDSSDQNCAEVRKGGWWYKNCTETNLNGFQHRGSFEGKNKEGITWYKFRGHSYSLKSTLLSVRPRFRN